MKYLEFYNKFKKSIEAGDLRFGTKVPSIRKLVEREGVSKNTVIRGLHLLEDKGYIEGRPKSGFYISYFMSSTSENISSLVPEKIRPVSKKVQRGEIIEDLLSSELSDKIIPLGTAIRFPDILPQKNINSVLKRVLKHYPDHGANYSFPVSNNDLDYEIGRHLSTFSTNINRKGIIRTFGATEALYLCLKLVTKPGDTVIIESPVFFGILLILRGLKLKVIEIGTKYGQGYRIDKIEEIIKREKIAAAIFSPNFTNPHGSLYGDGCKSDLVGLFNSKNIPLIEDDVNGDLAFSGIRPKMLASFDKKGIVFSCSSFSKTLGPGYRIGWIYNSKFQEELNRLKLSTSFSSQPLLELVISRYLREMSYSRYLKKLTKFFEGNIKEVKKHIGTYFPENCEFSEPLGGFSIWVKLPAKTNSVDFYNNALKRKIAISPGILFSNSLSYNNYIRLNCGGDCNYEFAIKELGKLLK